MSGSRFGLTDRLLVVGPCAAESQEQLRAVASSLRDVSADWFRAGVWKPRTRPSSFEGVGEKGLEWLAEIRKEFGLRVCTEVASPYHVEQCLAHGLDALWIGARTTTNPFSVQDIADALRGVDIPLFVKNPLNPDLKLWIGAIERLSASCSEVHAVHRGFSLVDNGIYRQTPLWQLPVELKRLMPGLKILCDPSHIAGRRDLVFPLAQKAMRLGFDGLMIEVHDNPDAARTDAMQQLDISSFKRLLKDLEVSNTDEDKDDLSLEELRGRIDDIDLQLLSLLGKRMELSEKVAEIKRENNMSIFRLKRWDVLLTDRMERAERLKLNREFVKDLFELIHEQSMEVQDRFIGGMEKN